MGALAFTVVQLFFDSKQMRRYFLLYNLNFFSSLRTRAEDALVEMEVNTKKIGGNVFACFRGLRGGVPAENFCNEK
jgi:hypothetical protein